MEYNSGLAQQVNNYPGQSITNQAPKRMSEVQEQVKRGSHVTGCMEDKFKSLLDRLQPVLRSTASAGRASDAKAPKPILVGHADALSNHNDQLEQMDYVLGDILDRLEL